MKKIVSILILGLFWVTAFAKNEVIAKKTQNLILKTFIYCDQNPSHKPESDSIVNVFERNLVKRTDFDKTGQFNRDIEKLFKYLYKNSLWEYEDSTENRRMKIRRAFCFASLALLSDDNKVFTFIEYAKLSIIEQIDNPDFYLLEEQLLGLNLFELLLKYERELISKHDILLIEKFLEDNQDQIKESLIDETVTLMKEFRIELK
ncbi:hypothetical protein GCQ56_15240 [Marinifilum sp. N1E240]|uniref:hypothetical protein n=1 Tax=Marinifilum sp. N1E240 TaxID=2608082 RepID=UPI00128BFF91|nr:hypothetical protein [Marinifilum sp. N1E240]MPQ48357.1 hypothetical protein [Marinifilum sp. N1E240]